MFPFFSVYPCQDMVETPVRLQKDIALLEKMRREGHEEFARDVANGMGAITEDIATLSSDQLQAYMHIWRIWVDTDLSLAQQTHDVEYATVLYENAKEAITTYYNDPFVEQAALEMGGDIHRSAYEMAANMYRDKGRYCFQVAQVTGNRAFLDRAVDAYDKALECAETGGSIHGLAGMERYEIRRKVGMCKRGDFKEYRRAFKQVIQSPIEENSKRDACWRYTGTSLVTGHPITALNGVVHFISNTPKPHEMGKYIFGEVRKSANRLVQRRTFQGNPHILDL